MKVTVTSGGRARRVTPAFLLTCAVAFVLLASGLAGVSSAHAATNRTAQSQPVPAALRPALYQALARDAGAAYRVKKDGCVRLPGQALTACFDGNGAHFSGYGSLALRLVAYGRFSAGQANKAKLTPLTPVRPLIRGNRVSYVHGNLTEWWRVLPIGLEQGFTIAERPSGHGELTLALAANAKASEHEGVLGWGKLRYGKLLVTDARGKIIPASLKTRGNRIQIAVNDAHAVYPVTVDPLVWLEQEVVANEGTAKDQFGWTVALDGDTALVGANTCGCVGSSGGGAAYVFKRINGIWTETQKLTADDETEDARFGWAVALDGPIAMVGDTFAGAVYVFNESDGVWAQTQKLVPSDPENGFFFGAYIDIDGTTALVGSPFANAAYVFNATDGTWSQTQKLTPSDGAPGDEFGISVALDGPTALVGAFGATVGGNTEQGAAYVFDESGGTWTQTQKLVANDGAAGDWYGIAVALEGNTAFVGAIRADTKPPFTNQGATYVFNESGGIWAQSQKLTVKVPPGGGGFGQSIALDGDTVIISANNAVLFEEHYFVGAAYIFKYSGGTWSEAQRLTASDGTQNDFFGWGFSSVALQNGTALIGAYNATVGGNEQQGKAYFYGLSDLGLALSAPETVGQGQQYVSQTIATNNASAASPAVAVTLIVPAAASFVSVDATQGSCSEDSGVVTCDFGQIEGNAGMATANVTLKATGAPGTTIENTASIAKSTPALTASAPTTIGESGSCPAGYTEFSGHLDAGETFTSSPITVTEAGEKYVDLTSPASFAFFAITTTRYGQHTYVYPHAKHGHRWGAAGSYQVGVQAGPGAGGDYTLCVNLNPLQ